MAKVKDLAYDPMHEQEMITEVNALVQKYGSNGAMLSPEQAQEATDLGKAIRDLKKQAEDHHEPIKRAAKAAHSEACNAEKKITEPLDKALTFLRNLIGQYKTEEARKAEQARMQREEEERKEREKALAAAQGQITKITKGIKKDEEKLAALSERLDDPDCGEVEAEAIRGQIEVLEGKISGKVAQVNEKIDQAENKSFGAAVSTPEPVKTTGAHGRKKVTVECTNIKALARAVADGALPEGCLKADLPTLKKLHSAGMDIKNHGCSVKEESVAVFR